MLQRIRERFGTAGLIVSVVALVLALAGGAFAASGGLNAKQKKQVKAIAKSFQGTGPAGAAGPAGPAGANGAAGGAGVAGANGKTVLSGTPTPTALVPAGSTIGDFYMDTDDSKMYGPKAAVGANGGWGTGTDLRGREGSPWTVGGTLPNGATLTGVFGPTDAPIFGPFIARGAEILVPVSFSLPLASAPTFVYVPGAFAAFRSSAGCPGVVSDVPKADPGKFCVYSIGLATDLAITAVRPGSLAGGSGATPVGTLLDVTCPDASNNGACDASGVWAVTGS